MSFDSSAKFWHHLGTISVKETALEENGMVVLVDDESLICELLKFVAFNPLPSFVDSWKRPGGVSSFSLSRRGLDSISRTWRMDGRREAAA